MHGSVPRYALFLLPRGRPHLMVPFSTHITHVGPPSTGTGKLSPLPPLHLLGSCWVPVRNASIIVLVAKNWHGTLDVCECLQLPPWHSEHPQILHVSPSNSSSHVPVHPLLILNVASFLHLPPWSPSDRHPPSMDKTCPRRA